MTAPIETLRLRMMVSGVAAGGSSNQLRELLSDARRTKGAALFAGNGANVARSAPAKGIDFFGEWICESRVRLRMVLGALAEGVTGGLFPATCSPPRCD